MDRGAWNCYAFDFVDMQMKQISEVWTLRMNSDPGTNRLVFVISGEGELYASDAGIRLEAGSLFVCQPGRNPYTVRAVRGGLAIYYIEFASAKTYRQGQRWAVEECPLPVQGIVQGIPVPIIRRCMETLYECWSVGSGAEAHRVQAGLTELWQSILTAGTDAKEPEASQAVIRSIRDYFDEHYTDTFPVEELACAWGMKPTSFFQSFKRSTSLSPLQYITAKRIEKARELLATRDMKIKEVSKAVGYADAYYFSRIFKSAVGVSPVEYMQSLRQTIVVLNPFLWAGLTALGIPGDRMVVLSKEEHSEDPAAELDLAPLRARQPNLILGSEKAAVWYDGLSELAPTRLIPYKRQSWREHLMQLAAAIGMEEVALYWIRSYERKAAAARHRIHQSLRNETVLAARIWRHGRVRVFGEQRRKVGDFLYRELRLNAPARIRGFAFEELDSVGKLNDYEADHILLFTEPGFDAGCIRELRGKVYLAGEYPWLHYSALGHEKALAEAVELFAKREF
ncbi:helix-turn-helix domain-containing protein [Paenibacillus sp. A3]|uniref:helix-turn-helix domain-containing protein n=1 Tax=Paenibacillus sp. A3 TaxID=1337054 RepID=UPI0006D5AF50|nr:AraC family transcriptional regulator [Paenibacillus sp. A3]